MNLKTAASALMLGFLVLAGCTDGTEPDLPRVSKVSVSPGEAVFEAIGDTLSFDATVTDQNGEVMPSAYVTWSSGDEAVVSVNALGRATSQGPGSTYIVARSGEVADSAVVKVLQRVAEYALSASRSQMLIGDTLQISEHATDVRGNDVPRLEVTWSSSAPGIAAVDGEGLVTALARGDVEITATAVTAHDTVKASMKVFVREEGDAFISAISPSVLLPGKTAILTGEGFAATVGGNAVTIAGVPATVLEASPTQITVRLPDRAAFACHPTREVTVVVTTDGIEAWRQHPLASAHQIDALGTGEYVNLPDTSALGCVELPLTGQSYLVSVYNTTASAEATSAFRLRGESGGVSTTTTLLAAAPRPAASPRAERPGSRLATSPATARAGHPMATLPRVSVFQALGTAPALGGPTSPVQTARTARHTASGRRAGPTAGLRTHHALLESSRELLERLGPPRAASSRGPDLTRHGSGVLHSPRSISAQPSTVGDKVSFRVPDIDSDNLCTTYSAVTGRVVYSGPKAIVVEDVDAPLAGTMDATYVKMAREFEEEMLPIIEEYFGDPFAMNDAIGGNGRITMLFSPTVNEFESVAGFVWGGDFVPREECAASDRTQIFYAIVPNDGGAVSDWERIMRSTVIHEVKHIVSYAERLARNGRLEESWLEESTARLAEELWARSYFGYTQNGDTGYRASLYCEVRPSWPECEGSPYIMMKSFDAIHAYMRGTNRLSPIGRVDDDDWTFYGTGWFLVRWAIDHFASDEAAFVRALIQDPNLTGVDNLTARTGTSFAELLAPWSLSLFWDQPTAPRLGHPSWDVHNIFAGLNSDFPDHFSDDYPLRTTERGFGSFDVTVGELRGGSTSLFTLSGSPGGTQLIELQGTDGGPPPSSLRISILRVQ